MALQKQLVHLNLTGGLQRNEDERLAIPSKLAVADNVEFDDSSTVVRRGGQAKHALTATQSPSVTQPFRMFTNNGNIVIESEDGLHRVNPTFGTTPIKLPTQLDMVAPSVFPRGAMSTTRIGAVDRKGTAYGAGIPIADGAIDCAGLDGMTCYVWETRDVTGYGRQAIRVAVIDDATGIQVYSNLLTGGAGDVMMRPRVIANASRFFIYFAQFTSGGTSWNLRVQTISSGLTVSAINTVATYTTGGTTGAANNMPLFDVAISPASSSFNLIGITAVVDNTTFEVEWRTVSLTNGYTVIAQDSFIASAAVTSLTSFVSAIGALRVHALFSVGTNVAYAAALNITAGTAGIQTVVGTAAVGTVVGRMTAYEFFPNILIAFDSYDTVGTGFSSCLRLSRCTSAYASLIECAGPAPWVIAGRIGYGRNRLYLPMAFVSDNYQATSFIVDLTSLLLNLGATPAAGPAPHVLARIDYGECALNSERYSANLRLPNLVTKNTDDVNPTGDVLIYPYLKFEMDARVVGAADETAFAAASATINLNGQLGNDETNGVTFLAGACPLIYDGNSCVEEGFHHGPELLGTSLTPAASGDYQLANATAVYTVCFTQAWQDAKGNWWESAPSNELQISITGGSGNYFFTPPLVTAPTLKPGARILMYRTRGSSTDTSLYIASRVDGSCVTDDNELINGEQLYTAGGVLPNTPAPSCRHVTSFQKRLVLSGCGDGSVIHWSKQSFPGFGIEFSDGDPLHQTTVPPENGRVVGTEELDDRLVVFCERTVGIIGGAGPTATGTQGGYSDYATTIPSLGAVWESPKSIVRGPGGVWFKSPHGIRFISQGGSLAANQQGRQFGSEVDDLVSGDMVAIRSGAKQQTRFYQDDTVLIYDHEWGQWTRFTNVLSRDAVFSNGRYYHICNVDPDSALLRYFDDSVTTDVAFDEDGLEATGIQFDSYIETSWLSFAGIQGFQRIYRLMLVGKETNGTTDAQAISGFFGYDFSVTSPPDEETFTAVVSPTTGGNVQLQHHMGRQKCESLKIGISFRPDTGLTGRFRLTDLTLQVGVKPGYYKLPSSKRY